MYFAVDADMNNYLTNVDNYFHGISDAMNEFYNMNGYKWSTGIYGSKSVVEYMHNRWGVTKEWQTIAWSSGNYYTGSEIYQYETDIPNYLGVFSSPVDKNGSNTTSRGRFTSLS
ncbi:glycoside hydrolase domain-containing protein [Tepidibacillus infernus]|nr:glycoside hydrolase domain-containing protein [Tepidibacillus decaturensis]